MQQILSTIYQLPIFKSDNPKQKIVFRRMNINTTPFDHATQKYTSQHKS